ncbi:MAG: ribosome biogenesis factor YjgA [Succinatimonas hippei]|nr:ribosome biogenesis factor YjgA [Succinatimonas hippei]
MVQQIQHFEGFDEKPDEFSRSARKRDAQEIRRQVENVANLGDQAFKNISLDPDVREAIEKARAMKINSDERRRQLQYAARLQRGVETQDLGEQIALLGASSKEDPDTMRFERLRSELISGGVSVVNSLCSLCKDLDRKKLMSLVRKAKAEFKQEQQTENTDVKIQKPESRRLYRYIKDEIRKAGIQVPETLLEKHS